MDTISALMENTRAGFYSGLEYQKSGASVHSNRIVEPRRLVQGPEGLNVRTLQIQPESGLRTFRCNGIVNVWRHECRIPPHALARNTFASGELEVGTATPATKSVPRAMSPGFAVEFPARAKPAWLDSWFYSYACVVRDAVLDLQISEEERHQVLGVRAGLGLNQAQVRAVHAYIFAQEMMGATADGSFEEEDFLALQDLNSCLRQLGAAPGG